MNEAQILLISTTGLFAIFCIVTFVLIIINSSKNSEKIRNILLSLVPALLFGFIISSMNTQSPNLTGIAGLIYAIRPMIGAMMSFFAVLILFSEINRLRTELKNLKDTISQVGHDACHESAPNTLN